MTAWPTSANTGHSLLFPRAGCPANTYRCPASLGLAFNDLCCENGQVCALDAYNNPACCLQGAVCTGAAPAPAPTAATALTSYVPNSYFPFLYAPTTFDNGASCLSASQSCSRNYDGCLMKLRDGSGYHVTVAVPGESGTVITGGGAGLGGAQATAICSSLSSKACVALSSETCSIFGQGSDAPRTISIQRSWPFVALAVYVLQLV